jgi:hypothetical protein
MFSRISALVASIIACAAISSARAAAHPRIKLPADFAEWAHVATCESGGWRVLGSSYPDPVGITAHNWAWAGGRPLPPGRLTLKQEIYVVSVADRFIRMLHIGIPDSGGSCAAW